MREALQLFRQFLDENHPNVGRVTENLGILYAAQGRIEEVRSLYQQALAILEPKRGRSIPGLPGALEDPGPGAFKEDILPCKEDTSSTRSL